jgi:acid phosphatase type 7
VVPDVELPMRRDRKPAQIVFFVLAVLGAPAAGQTITRGPYLQDLRATSVEVLWSTDAPSFGGVRFGQDPQDMKLFAESSPGTTHRMQLGGLLPGTTYVYQVLDGGRVLREEGCRFRTAPPPGPGAIRIGVAGDSGIGNDDQASVADVLKEISPDLFLHTGDMDYRGDPDAAIFGPYREVLPGACFFPVMGNHDLLLYFPRIFFPPGVPPEQGSVFYSFDYGNGHFVALDTNFALEPDGNQMVWLQADLESSRGTRPWTILFFHKPAFTVGAYVSEAGPIRAALSPLLDRFAVDLVLTGHDHNYQRSHPVRDGVVHDAWQSPRFESPRGTIHVITGGGGNILYPELRNSDHRFSARFISAFHALDMTITESLLSVKAVAPDRQILDEFTIAKGVPTPELRFIRGDADMNGRIDIADPIKVLLHLFAGEKLECPLVERVVADVDGSGGPPDIADPVRLLSHLFAGGPPPAPPYPDCGSLPGQEDAWCRGAACPR